MAQPIESWLARDTRKRAHYGDDPYFWEGQAAYLAARPAREALRHLTFLLVKPETIVGRRVEPIVAFLQAGGFRTPASGQCAWAAMRRGPCGAIR